MEDKTTPNIMKFGYTWFVVSMAINILFIGYVASGALDHLSVSEDTLFNYFTEAESGTDTSINSINALTGEYNTDDLTASESQSGTILDALDQLWAFGKWTWFMVRFITVGQLFTGLMIADMISNDFVSLIFIIFFAIGNLIYVYLVYKFIMNKGRFD